MYQRLAMAGDPAVRSLTVCSASKAQHRCYEDTNELVRDQEEDRRDRHHYEHHGSGNRGFPTRRPSDLLRLLAHLLQELEYVCLGHDRVSGGRTTEDGYIGIQSRVFICRLSSVFCPLLFGRSGGTR